MTVPFQITSATWRSSSISTRLPSWPFERGVGCFAFASAASVCGPIVPSRSMPAHFWNAIVALNVAVSLTPSASALSMNASSTSLRSVWSRLGFAAGFFFAALGAGGPPFGLPSIAAVTGFARSTPGWSVCRTFPFTSTRTDFTPCTAVAVSTTCANRPPLGPFPAANAALRSIVAMPFSTATCFSVTLSGSCVRRPLRSSAPVGPSRRRAIAVSVPLPARLRLGRLLAAEEGDRDAHAERLQLGRFRRQPALRQSVDGAVLPPRALSAAVQRAEQCAALLDGDAVAARRWGGRRRRSRSGPGAAACSAARIGESYTAASQRPELQQVEEGGRRTSRAAASSPGGSSRRCRSRPSSSARCRAAAWPARRPWPAWGRGRGG